MRPLFFLILLLIIGTSVSAQHFELGFNGGVGYNGTVQYQPAVNFWGRAQPITNSPVGSLKGVYTSKKWQYGLSVDYRKASYWTSDFSGIIEYYWAPGTTAAQMDAIMRIPHKVLLDPKAYYPVKLFVNRKIALKNFEIYGGLSCGYVFIPGLRTVFLNHDMDHSFSAVAHARTTFNKNGWNGLLAGMQAGGTYFITKRIGINAELGTDYISFRQDWVKSRVLTSLATTGIRYRF